MLLVLKNDAYNYVFYLPVSTMDGSGPQSPPNTGSASTSKPKRARSDAPSGGRSRFFLDQTDPLKKIREYTGETYSVLSTAGREMEKETRINRYVILRESVGHIQAVMSVISQRTPGNPLTKDFLDTVILPFTNMKKKIGCYVTVVRDS